MTEIVQHRGGTAAAWTAANTVLYAREIGVETDTDKFKIGDGSTPWNALPYAGGSGAGAAADIAVTPTGSIAATDVQAALAELDTEKVATSSKGVANGVASLGADGKVPSAQLPAGTGGGAVPSGLLSARPAASTVVDGLYFATDDNGGTLYHSNGTTWVAAAAGAGIGGQELAYAEITSTFSMSSTTETAIPGLSVTFAAPGTPVVVEFCAYMDCSTSGENVGVHLSQDTYNPTASYILETGLIAGGTDKYETVYSKRRYTPTAGQHTISAYIMSNTTSTKRVVATPYVPAFVRVTKA